MIKKIDMQIKKIAIQKLFRLAREERATALVEFAFTLWALLALVFGLLQCGFALYAYHFTSDAAQQGARFAMVRGYTWSENTGGTYCLTSPPPNFTMVYSCTAQGIIGGQNDIQNFVQSMASPGITNTSPSLVANPNWPGTNADGTTTGCSHTNAQGCLVQVQVQYTYSLIPFLPITNVTMSATSEKTILQ